MNLTTFTIFEAHQGLIKKEFSAQELTLAFLEKIKKEDKNIKSFLEVNEELAISQAKEADKLISKEKEIPLLAGIPCAIKDNILVKDVKCSAASKILENYIAPYDATVVKKLKNQGAIILGKTNLDEFAMGSSTENSAFGPTHNPYDLERVPGGSSGGSAAAVAANMATYSLGSDTGGSIRQPASFCGVVGLKPTYGAVSRYGLIAFASSLDQIGPIAKSVGDAKIVFEAIKGHDAMDSTSVKLNPKQFQNQNFKIQNLKIGLPKEYFVKGLDEGVKQIIEKAAQFYKKLGAKIIEINLPLSKYALPCYYIIAPSEASANLARFDGIKYGKTINEEKETNQDLIDYYLKVRGEGFGDEVKRRIMLGTYCLSSGYYDAYYKRALKIRTKIIEDFQEAFNSVDIILTPTSPTPAFKIGEKANDPLSMYLSDIYTVSVNLAGLPAISIPGGKINGLPVGIQFIAPAFSEEKLFSIASIFEKNYDSRTNN